MTPSSSRCRPQFRHRAAHVSISDRLIFIFMTLQPVRCYYQCRNLIYFWMHERKPRRLPQTMRVVARSCLFTAGFMVRPLGRPRQIVACLRGIWDGVDRQYYATLLTR